jgi:hypothetical protein
MGTGANLKVSVLSAPSEIQVYPHKKKEKKNEQVWKFFVHLERFIVEGNTCGNGTVCINNTQPTTGLTDVSWFANNNVPYTIFVSDVNGGGNYSIAIQ